MISPGSGRRADNPMPQFKVTRRVSLKPEQIFAVIADVGSYREFVPLVERSTVRGREADTDAGEERFKADLVVAYHPLRVEEHFLSDVETSRKGFTVKTASRGPAIKSLDACWTVADAGDGQSDVTFEVAYELKGFFLQKLFSGMFDYAVRKIMMAFEDRARSLYST
jgi:coenzyme Q-binding protein COQ10